MIAESLQNPATRTSLNTVKGVYQEHDALDKTLLEAVLSLMPVW